MSTIKAVEIFSTGTHNGDAYTEQDLDEMVSAFGELDYRPAIKIGHTKDAPGAPAYGWVQNVRRIGTKLVADFTDMHDSVVNSIRKKLYDNVSAEIYFNLKRGGKVFKRALKAVALLGAEVPAVAGLIPLHRMQFAAEGEFGSVTAYARPFDADAGSDRPGMEVDRRVRALMRAEGVAEYSAALSRVLGGDPELAAAYGGGGTAVGQYAAAQETGEVLDLKAKELMRLDSTLNYESALSRVIALNPGLAQAYLRGGNAA